MSLLAMEQVSRRYPAAPGGDGAGGNSRPVFEGLDLAVEAGESVAIVGPSGAGKTTLLYLAAGLCRPSSGRVAFDGRDLAGLGSNELARLRRESIALVFQNNLSLSALPVWENVAIPLLLRGEKTGKARERAEALLAEVELAEWAQAPMATLSGGQRQRMGIARAMATRPKLLLADEPTADLDEGTAERIERLLFDWLAREGCAALIVTHSATVERRAQRVLRLDGGRLAPIESPAGEERC